MFQFSLATLSLSKNNGFYLHPNYLKRNGNETHNLLGLEDAKGKWIQVFDVMLKDENGDYLMKN
jgi:hypothetical protein